MTHYQLGAACVALVLVACSGDSTEPPTGFTVSGVVVDEKLRPQVNRSVAIVGGDPILTDAEGRFTFSKVSSPYDLAVSLIGETGAIVYSELTRPDPTIVVPPNPWDHDLSFVWIIGEVEGLAPFDRRAEVFLESAAGAAKGEGSRDYTISFFWLGTSTIPATIHALEWDLDHTTGLPAHYTSYGSTTVSLPPRSNITAPTIHASTGVETTVLSGEVSLPTGHELVAKRLFLGFGVAQQDAWSLATESGPNTSFSFATPEVSGASFTVQARATSNGGVRDVFRTGLRSSDTEVTVAIPPAPELVSPAHGFDNLTYATQFSWSPRQNAVYLFALRYAGSVQFYPEPRNVYVFTTRHYLTLPELRRYGVHLYEGQPYQWQVYDWTPLSNVDQIAVPTWYITQGDRTAGSSAARTAIVGSP